MIILHRNYTPFKDYDPAKEPLTWKPCRDGDRMTASVVCANGHDGIISDHTIDPSGLVTPSVVCTICGWHEYIRLEEWLFEDKGS